MPSCTCNTLIGPVSLAWMGATSLIAGAGMTFGFSLKRAILGGNLLSFLPAEAENALVPEDLEMREEAINRFNIPQA